SVEGQVNTLFQEQRVAVGNDVDIASRRWIHAEPELPPFQTTLRNELFLLLSQCFRHHSGGASRRGRGGIARDLNHRINKLTTFAWRCGRRRVDCARGWRSR